MKYKRDWLRQLRRHSSTGSVEKVAKRIAVRLEGKEYLYFQEAVEHRLAEIEINELLK
ncbi:hemolysin activation protein [Sodalis-like symbiont of Philaenus spumarius]|nr:hemolysin activation protein [Sodalis-like symbiont of Philaenus spumarius]